MVGSGVGHAARGNTRSSGRRIPKMAEVITAELRSEILLGELKPGESLLSEAILMERYEVSRPTLREALRLLEAQDLITVRRGSHRGPVVSLPDGGVAARAVAIQLQLRDATMADVYQFRMTYEPAAARAAAEKATPDDISALRGILEEEASAVGSTAGFAEAAWRFHSVLMAVSGNATMAVVTECLQHISVEHAARGLSSTPEQKGHEERAVKAHRKLVGLIETGKGVEAERFWVRHMQAVNDLQAQWLEDQQITELLN